MRFRVSMANGRADEPRGLLSGIASDVPAGGCRNTTAMRRRATGFSGRADEPRGLLSGIASDAVAEASAIPLQ